MLTPNYHAQALFMQNRPDAVLPTRVQSPLVKPPKAAGKIGVGAWNSEVEYKDIKVVAADGRTLFESDFSKGFEGWKTARGEWKVVDGALRQTAMVENARALVGDPAWSDYTLTLKARKLGGQEGFLILFETADIESPVWWNLGGWSNSDHVLQGTGMPEQRMPGKIENDRWYDLKIETRAEGVKGWLDGKLLQEGSRRPVSSVYAVAGTRGQGKAKEIILSVVNASSEPRETAVAIEGVARLAKTARLTLLTSGSQDDVNTIEEPGKIAPVTQDIEIAGPKFSRAFPANSLSVIRLKVEK
jgi:alpha-L-arabinofuranosidase